MTDENAKVDKEMVATPLSKRALEFAQRAWRPAGTAVAVGLALLLMWHVVEGKNGFVCMVERAWMNPFDSPEFWNPKNRSPICLNPPAARTVLPITLMRTKLVLAGKSKDEIKDSIKAAIKKKELPELEAGAMSYMMSKDAYLTDKGGHNMAHLMFYMPLGTVWGANVVDSSSNLSEPFPGSPLLLAPSYKGNPEPIDMFLIGTGVWSDGTPAPM